MNVKILKELRKQLDEYKISNNSKSKKWKIISLSKGIDAITRYNKKIKSGNDVIHLDGIGKGIAKRIDEILKTGKISGTKNMSKEEENKKKILELFTSITGVGPVKALNWYKSNFKSIKDIKDAIKNGLIKSTHHIDLGLKYYNDFKKEYQEMKLIKLILFLIK